MTDPTANNKQKMPGKPNGSQLKQPKPINSKLDAKTISQVAMMTALIVLMGFLANYITIFSFIAPLALPLPICIIIIRQGLGAGLLTLICSALLLSVLTNPFAALAIILQYCLIGFFFGYCFTTRRKPLVILAGGTLIAAVTTIISLLISAYIAGFPLSDMISQFESYMLSSLETIKNSPGLADMLPEGTNWQEYSQTIINFYKKILPAILILTAMLMSFASYLLAVIVLRRLGYKIKKLPKFEMWRMDWRLLWGFIIALACLIAGYYLPNDTLMTIASNLFYIYLPLMFICGLSFAVWYLRRWQINMLLKALFVIVLISLFIYTAAFLVIISIFDPLLDFRKRVEKFNKKTV
ncbi:MAG: YybS family protein [Clostridia bacterium]|nr:YybS family protein [Clostridia bacterium]